MTHHHIIVHKSISLSTYVLHANWRAMFSALDLLEDDYNVREASLSYLDDAAFTSRYQRQRSRRSAPIRRSPSDELNNTK